MLSFYATACKTVHQSKATAIRFQSDLVNDLESHQTIKTVSVVERDWTFRFENINHSIDRE